MHDQETTSERAVRDLCRIRGIALVRLPVGAASQPDFEITCPCGPVVVEVKEITANQDDIDFVESMEKFGQASESRRIGARVRAAIQSAKPQLKAHKNRRVPRAILLYDNRVHRGTRRDVYAAPLNDMDIDAGMFGQITVEFSFRDGDAAGGRTKHGGKRMLDHDRGRYVSAVMVLYPAGSASSMHMRIYHNPWAIDPLWPGYFPDPADVHLVKDHDRGRLLPDWQTYVGPRNCAG